MWCYLGKPVVIKEDTSLNLAMCYAVQLPGGTYVALAKPNSVVAVVHLAKRRISQELWGTLNRVNDGVGRLEMKLSLEYFMCSRLSDISLHLMSWIGSWKLQL